MGRAGTIRGRGSSTLLISLAGFPVMRHFVFLAIGGLELVIGIQLIQFGCELPAGADVEESFDRAQHVTRTTSSQVHLLREQVQELRKPELQQASREFEMQTRLLTAALAANAGNYDALKMICEALGNVSSGLEGLALTLDPNTLGQLGQSLAVVADYLDMKVVPGAN